MIGVNEERARKVKSNPLSLFPHVMLLVVALVWPALSASEKPAHPLSVLPDDCDNYSCIKVNAEVTGEEDKNPNVVTRYPSTPEPGTPMKVYDSPPSEPRPSPVPHAHTHALDPLYDKVGEGGYCTCRMLVLHLIT